MSRQTSTPKTRTRRCSLPLVLVLLLCAVCGCATPEREPIRLEAYSWWTGTSERNAFASVLGIYNQAHEDAEAFNGVTGDSDAVEVRKLLTARLLANAPPSTFQANAGADLLRWTAMDTTNGLLDSASRITPLGELFQRTQLDQVLPLELYEALLAGPQSLPYAVPLNIHRLNLIYYNAATLRDYRKAHGGRSFLELAVLCPENVAELLQDRRQQVPLRIAVGMKDGFTLTLFALENLLPAIAGAEPLKAGSRETLYDQLFLGKLEEAKWHEPVLRAFQCLQYLSRSFVRDKELSWADALTEVAQGRADFSVMGDWANGELETALSDGRVDAQPFPGSAGTFVFTSDTFPLPNRAPYFRQSEDLLETLASADAQLAFSLAKGSIPARSDISVETIETVLGTRAAQTRRDFDSPYIHKSIATSGLFPQYYPDLSGRLAAMTVVDAEEPSISEMMAFIRNTLPLLDRWQSRISKSQQSQ